MEKLTDILSHRRGHDSNGEWAFIEKYLIPMNPMIFKNDKGEEIAYAVTVDNTPTLWSCHIDTMHRTRPDVVMQEVWLDDMTKQMFVSGECDCLGADDGAGVWLLLEMIAHGSAGTFIFHRGEETGCWGSRQMAMLYTSWLAQFDHAIAFDRRGTRSVITHQFGERGISDAFADRMIALLDMAHEHDPTGSYTDTKEYFDIIPECTNISLGYDFEHGPRETLDVEYLFALRDALVAVDWSKAELPVMRDPSVAEFDDERWGVQSSWGWSTPNKKNGKAMLEPNEVPTFRDLLQCGMGDIREWVKNSDTETIGWLISDLVDKVCENMNAIDEGEDDDHLPVGLC